MEKKGIREILLQLEQDLKNMINAAEQTGNNHPRGTLRITNIKGVTRYYHNYTDEKGNKQSRYISPKKDSKLINDIAQGGYESAFLKTAYKQLHAVQRALKDIDEDSLVNVYSLLHNERKKLINPFLPDDETFVRNWENDSYQPGYFPENTPEIYTERRERVRSKSEKIIADKYKMMCIPYKYEKPLILVDRSQFVTLRPDFTTLNVRTRKQYYHEHLGKMDEPKYVRRNLYKLSLYEKNGIYIGDQLLLTLESSDRPLDMQQFEIFIKRYLL